MSNPSYLDTPNHHRLAYHHHACDKYTTPPTVVFLGGLMSDMNGTKALYLDAYCKSNGYPFIRFDYVGHGESSGQFTDGTIGLWKENALEIIDRLTQGKLILIGSSLGGWLMLLAALERPERIHALIGIASAPDFTEALMWDVFTDGQKQALLEKGIIDLPSDYSDHPYPITRALIEEGRKHLLLEAPIPLTCPLTLIHGMKDDDVPFDFSLRIAKVFQGEKVKTILLKDGDHRMSDEGTLQVIVGELEGVL
jgi:pimeloyl-ACP methyl ester carboxylesterase